MVLKIKYTTIYGIFYIWQGWKDFIGANFGVFLPYFVLKNTLFFIIL